jgi:hypothetical protein
MPRNSSGTYSLYTPGNPVVTSTVISSTWANNTLADLASAITDSLSRTGDGGMQAPLELDNGAIGAPALTWATETTSGLYRNAAGDFRFSVSAADVFRFTATGMVAGSATGGQQGAGTINATGIYDDGVLLANAVAANPTGTIGLTAVNGVLNTFPRSDSAPALSQAIVPTWTGIHTWGMTTPETRFYETDQAAGSRLWRDAVAAQIRTFQIGDDAAGTLRNWLAVYRSGAGVDALEFGNATNNPSFAFLGTGAAAFGGNVTFTISGSAFNIGYRQIPRSTTATTFVAADVGRCVAVSAAINIPISVFAAGDAISVYNDSGSAVNITISAGTLRLSGTATTGTRSLAARGYATLWFNVGGATPEVVAMGDVS